MYNLKYYYTFMLLNNVAQIGSTLYSLNTTSLYPSDYAPKLKDGDIFDFIVVGAGSGGSVVASRLSENPAWRILHVEAGGYPSAATEVPFKAFTLYGTPEDWDYGSVKNDYHACYGMKNNICKYPRGHVLGGSSAINIMLYVRGNRKQYDSWRDRGNPGWGYDDLLKYFKKSENVQYEPLRKNSRIHGIDGPLKVSYSKSESNMRKILLNAAREAGQPINTDEKPLGYYESLTTIYKGQRMSVAKAYLPRTKDRKNFFLAMRAQVGKIIVDPKKLRARSIFIKIDGREVVVHAKKEIILSAGAIATPQILMNSGIGPRNHLQEKNVTVIRDLPVGEYMEVHRANCAFYIEFNKQISNDSLYNMEHFRNEYMTNRTGPLAGVDITNIIGTINTKHQKDYQNVQMHHLFVPRNLPQGAIEMIRSCNYKNYIINHAMKSFGKKDMLLIIGMVAYSKTTNRVRLTTSHDLYAKPSIYEGKLADEDLQIYLEFLRYVQKLLKTKSFAQYKPKILEYPIESCMGFRKNSDNFWKCQFEYLMSPFYHVTSTCPMAPLNDSKAVVDSRLRVHGIKALRIVDASIMPNIPSGNTNVPTITIGEKASDLIKEDWNYKISRLFS